MAFAKHRIIASVAGILAPDWIVLIILVVIVVLPFWGIIPKPKNFPPGPPKWPIIGNMFQMKTDGYTHRKMSKWHKKYGEVVGFFVGEHPVVLISGVSAIKEGLGREDLSGRLGNKVLQIMNNGKRLGIVNTEGDVWKEQRTFVHHHLRQPNIGKCSQETIIHNEVKAILDDIEKMSGGSATGYYQPPITEERQEKVWKSPQSLSELRAVHFALQLAVLPSRIFGDRTTLVLPPRKYGYSQGWQRRSAGSRGTERWKGQCFSLASFYFPPSRRQFGKMV